MRVLHTGDIHLGELNGPIIDGANARMMDTVACMNFLADKAAVDKPDAILISGDMFHRSRLWSDEMLGEIGIAATWLRRLAAIAPTVLMFGTRNHDSLKAFENIKSMGIIDLYVVTSPKLFPLHTASGPLQIGAVPGFDKAYFRSQNPGMSAEDENQLCSQMLGSVILGISAKLNPAEPSVLMAHYAVAGAEYDNGENIFANSEVVLPLDALSASSFDLVCLGHIHRSQSISNCGRPSYYSGALNAITFNEEGQDKGFWTHELDGFGKFSKSQFTNTPYRKFHTSNWGQRDIESFIAKEPMCGFALENAIVRLHYSCSDELNKRLNRKELEKALYESGAFHVAEVRPSKVFDGLNTESMSESVEPLTALAAWLLSESGTADEVDALLTLARPLVATVSAKLPTGKLSGVFEPLSLEVKNYRSYREESFDFTKVSFATVNGPNGVGKSAFFMDAIKDCLYEETRENDIEAWISRPDAKSGTITFVFRMGDSVWRVTRTRTRSGKSTLALDEKKEDTWVPHSADDKRETQKRIVAMLGMDAATFQSCALIMQDAYGLFLEAGKEDRMQVIANILGLGVYDDLTDLAKAKVTEVNREMEKIKAQIADIDTRLSVKPSLESQQREANAEIETVQTEITSKEADLQTVQVAHAALVAKLQRSGEIAKQAQELRNDATVKTTERNRQQGRLEVANKLLAQEDLIEGKVIVHEVIKEKVTVLKVKRDQKNDLEVEKNRIESEIRTAALSLIDIGAKITRLEATVADRPRIEKASKEYGKAILDLADYAKLEQYHHRIILEINDKGTKRLLAINAHEASKSAYQHEAETLAKKAAMLVASNCVDIEQAKCQFLADAKASRDKIPLIAAQQATKEAEENQAIDAIRNEIEALEYQLNAVGFDSTEYTMLQELVADLKPLADQFVQLHGMIELLDGLKEQRTDLESRQVDLNTRLETTQKQYQALADGLRDLPDLEEKLLSLAQFVTLKDELPAAREVATTASERIAALNGEIDAATLKANALDQEATLLRGNGDLLKLSMDKKLSEAQEAIKTHRDRHSYLVGQLGGILAKLEALKQDETDRDSLLDTSKTTSLELIRYQKLAAAFGDDGIPFRIVRSVVPELSALANDILGQMTGGKMAMEMRTERVQKSSKKEVNALEIWITDYLRGAMPYKSRSGGQKVKAALSVAFALADLKARRAGIQLGMMFVDEPPFLDADGVDAYCDALELLSQRYPNMRVIAISHDPRMKARFPQEINVEDTGEGGSKVRLAS